MESSILEIENEKIEENREINKEICDSQHFEELPTSTVIYYFNFLLIILENFNFFQKKKI